MMSMSGVVGGVIQQFVDQFGQKVVVDFQDFWSEHPQLQDQADGVLSDMTALLKAVLGVEE